MTIIAGWSTNPAAENEGTGTAGDPIRSWYGSSTVTAQNDGTPDQVTFMMDGQFNPNGAIFRLMLYRASDRALVSYSDWVDDANITVNTEETVSVTSLLSVTQGESVILSLEQDLTNGTGNPNLRNSLAATDINLGDIEDGGATSGYTQNLSSPPDPLPSFDSSTSANQNGVIFYFEQTATAPSITSVTDSVGSTADQITEGQNATAQLSEAATVTGAELQNAAGDRVATLPIQSSTSDSVTVQGARGQLRYGDTDNKVVLTLDGGSTIEYTGITFAAPANVTWVNGTSADTTSDNSFAKGMSSTPSDYQGAFTDTSGGAINPVINSDLTVDSVEEPGAGTFEIYDNTDGTWGDEATYSLALDTTVTLITDSIPRRIGSRMAARPASNRAVYSAIYRG